MTLVGHDLMSDELVTRASALARDAGTDAHVPPLPQRRRRRVVPRPHRPPPARPPRRPRRARPARAARPRRAPRRRRGRVVLARRRRHRQLPVGVPPPRPGRGPRRAARGDPRRGGRVALGCDSRERRRPRRHPARRRPSPPASPSTPAAPRSAPTPRSSWPRSAAPTPIGMGDELGSLEPGKRADVVVVDTTGPNWVPRSPDPVLQLVWASDGARRPPRRRAGRVVVRDGECTTVDRGARSRAEAADRQRTCYRGRLRPVARWPDRPTGER